jgi:hypothetical protein
MFSSVPCFNYPDARSDLMLPYGDSNLFLSWAVLILMGLVTLAATAVLIKRLDKAQ